MAHILTSPRTINVQEFLDDQRFSAFHLLVLVLCFLIVALDGFDAGAIGYIAPALVQTWKIPRESLGPVLSAAFIGLGIGALIAGPAADRLGRKAVLITSVVFFGVWSLAASRASSMESLVIFRLLTGLGLGAAMPNSVTLMSEYAPQRIRGVVVNTMFMGFAAGLLLGGVVSAWLIPSFGWRSVLVAGGIVPLALSFVLLIFLPESVKYLVVRRQPDGHVAKILMRIAPNTSFEQCVFTTRSDQKSDAGERNPVLQLFSVRYIRGTLLLWLTYFMCLTVYYLLTNWLPTLFKASGFTLRQAVITTSVFHLGGCLGVVIAGWLMDRFKAIRMVCLLFVLTAVLVVAVGPNLGHQALLSALIFFAGLTLSGAVGSMAPIAAEFYPTANRATGVAWLLAVGRLGSVAGSFGGALVVGLGWQFGAIFASLAVPLGLAAIALFSMPNR